MCLTLASSASAAPTTPNSRHVPSGRRFDLFHAPDGAYIDTVTSTELRRGISVTIPAQDGASVIAIRPAG